MRSELTLTHFFWHRCQRDSIFFRYPRVGRGRTQDVVDHGDCGLEWAMRALKASCMRSLGEESAAHLLTDHQGAERVRSCRQWLEMFHSSSPKWFSCSTKRLSYVFTGDACWVSFFTNKDEASNVVWLRDEDLWPKVLKMSFRSKKRMVTIFVNSQSNISLDILLEQRALLHEHSFAKGAPESCWSCANSIRIRVFHHHVNACADTAARNVTFLNVQCLNTNPAHRTLLLVTFASSWNWKRAIWNVFSRIQELLQSVHSKLPRIPPSKSVNVSRAGSVGCNEV